MTPVMVHSERFERPTLGIEIRCSIQLSYECDGGTIAAKVAKASPARRRGAILLDVPALRRTGGQICANRSVHIAACRSVPEPDRWQRSDL